MPLFTFGYEGRSIDAFIARLTALGIDHVIDVRELPLSRKRGFSKTAFRDALHQAGILYHHNRAFGCPRVIRNRLKADGNWDFYVRSFDKYLNKQQDEVAKLAHFANNETVCLVCFEADYDRCHRSLIARSALAMGLARVCHLTITGVVVEEAAQRAA